jgi:hypothetical protein
MKEKPISPTETIVLHEIEEKTAASYQFVKEGRPGNPTSLHPKNFKPSKPSVIFMPAGSSAMILRGDGETIDELISKARAAGLTGITVQVRRAYGGVGNGKSEALKHAIKSGQISTENTGFKVLLPELEL